MKNEKFDRAITGLLVACALGLTFLVARRELGGETPNRLKPRSVEDWQQYHSGAKVIGPSVAPVSILVFSDFQCPFCVRFAQSLKGLRGDYPQDVRIVFRNFPIRQLHPHAAAAAAAAECAAQYGAFAALHDLLFDNPDSVGQWAWSDVAARVGIRQREEFVTCMSGDETLARMRDDSSAAIAIGLTGTPTIMVNRWLIPSGAPADSVLRELVVKELGSR